MLRTSEKITSEKMPMFGSYMILYVMIFASSIVIPLFAKTQVLIIFGANLLLYVSFGLAVFVLSLIPLAFDKFRYRLSAPSIINFLTIKAKKHLKNSDDWSSEVWSLVKEIERVAIELHKDRVDDFAIAIGQMMSILDESEKIRMERKKKGGNIFPPQEKWVGDFYRRVLWTGQKLVGDPFAYERVCAQSRICKTFKETNITCHLMWNLCIYAARKKEYRSLAKALHHSIIECGKPSFQLIHLTPYFELQGVVEDLKIYDPTRAKDFDDILDMHLSKS